ncbi:hypothetical protein CPB83DRAFT_858399 [Crepidotus variabilis]|uniref:C2H2-type domain-containing protein n=1 Tax=Crepidotus variabilis TaxID=179855 RepID=A0A9P6EBV7_9AGAR|nr:hypothetical protein CPB83DRAFT_858399 [Crepidotus variabilis]
MLTTINLTKENISDISKNVFQPGGYSCDWLVDGKTCKIVLGSWKTYSQHLYQHCQEHHAQRKCQIHWCNILPRSNKFTSVQKLFEHVEKHLEKSPLHCPIRDCESTFTYSTRSRSVTDHFLEVHLPLLGTSVALPSDVFAPTLFPVHLDLPQPPNLPGNIFKCSILTGEVANTRSTSSWESFGSQAPTPSQMPSTPQKRRMLPAKLAPTEDKPRGPTIIEFDNLTPTLDKDKNWIGSLKGCALIRGKGQSVDISRPQPTLTKDFHSIVIPPRSIFFDVYAQQYEEKYGPVELDDEAEAEAEEQAGDPMVVDQTNGRNPTFPPVAPSQAASSSTSAL